MEPSRRLTSNTITVPGVPISYQEEPIPRGVMVNMEALQNVTVNSLTFYPFAMDSSVIAKFGVKVYTTDKQSRQSKSGKQSKQGKEGKQRKLKDWSDDLEKPSSWGKIAHHESMEATCEKHFLPCDVCFCFALLT